MPSNGVNKAIYFTAGLCLGGGVTYILVKKRYRLLAEEEIASVKETFQKIAETKARQAAADWNPTEASEAREDSAKKLYDQAMDAMEYSTFSKDEPLTDVEVGIHDEDIDIAVKTTERDPNRPYEIDVSDFFNNDEAENVTITYWDKDDTLVDERDVQIQDVDTTVGIPNLLNLSQRPESDSVMYIRNERMNVDFEVIRDSRSYSQIVLGLKEYDANDIQEKPKVKKMRSDDG